MEPQLLGEQDVGQLALTIASPMSLTVRRVHITNSVLSCPNPMGAQIVNNKCLNETKIALKMREILWQWKCYQRKGTVTS